MKNWVKFKEAKEEKNIFFDTDIGGFNQGRAFFSNHLEVLFQFLKGHLYLPGSSPFTPQLLVVPSHRIKQWLQMQLAQDPKIRIAFGFKIVFLEQALSTLAELLFTSQIDKKIPHRLELTLCLEKEMAKVMEEKAEMWRPLQAYLSQHQERLPSLVHHLAFLFSRYGVYGEKYVAQWEREPKQWQEALWQRIFHPQSPWTYPIKWLSSLKEKKEGAQTLSLHFFGFHHFSPLHFQFFQRAAKGIQVCFYHLSPCQEFWSDLRSKKEEHHLQHALKKKGISWEEEWHRYPTLLTTHGKLGRDLARVMEESNLLLQEYYIPPADNFQLGNLQKALLSLQLPQKPLEDNSLQIHSSLTPHREIETLYHLFLGFFAEEKITPREIVVMAPDITLYEPYIRAVFGKAIPFRIADLPLKRGNRHIAGFYTLLSLEKRRWSASALLELFSHPLFLERQGWDGNDLQQIQCWIEQTGIRWGVDGVHRQRILQKKMEDAEGASWKEGVGSLLEELAVGDERERIDFSQAALLGELGEVVESLYAALSPLYDKGKKTLGEWVSWAKTLTERYFAVSEKEREPFFNCLDALEQGACFFADRGYAFSTFDFFLSEILSQEKMTVNANEIEAVQFCSLLPGAAIPSGVICLLGMNAEAFPRRESFFSLNLLRGDKQVPSRLDSDRYLFLEVLIAAQKKCIFSYLYHPSEDKYGISSVLAEVMPYIADTQKKEHPCFSFDARYFQKSAGQIKNFSQTDYHIAKSLLAAQDFSLLPSLCTPVKDSPERDQQISIEKLMGLIRFPIKSYLQKRQGIYLKEEKHVKDEEEFMLTPLQWGKWKSQILQNPQMAILDSQELPLGAWRRVAQTQFLTEREQVDAVRAHFSLQKQERTWTLELVPHEKTIRQVAENVFHLPALEIPREGGGQDFLVGRLEGITSKGMLAYEEANLRGAVRFWPAFLILNALPELPAGLCSSSLLFAKGGKVKTRFFQQALPFLRRLVDYYFFTFQKPSLLIPDWMGPLLNRDLCQLEKSIENAFSAYFYDPYFHWLFRQSPPTAEFVVQHWHPWAITLYQEMRDAWF